MSTSVYNQYRLDVEIYLELGGLLLILNIRLNAARLLPRPRNRVDV